MYSPKSADEPELPLNPSDAVPGSLAHRHRPAKPSPSDTPFIRIFLLVLGSLLTFIAGLNWLVDPLAVFGTGLLPPVVTVDRDYKAMLYRRLAHPPEVLLLGSSRVKPFEPACVSNLTGRPAFNFAVAGAGTEDYLAVLRFVRTLPGFRVRQILVGIDPAEALQDNGGMHRPLDLSRSLRNLVDDPPRHPSSVSSAGADLLGWQSLQASLRALVAHAGVSPELPDAVLDPDGSERRPRLEAAIRESSTDQEALVRESIPGVRGRYTAFSRLSPQRRRYLETFAREAREAGIEVVAFIPPNHPDLVRAAEGTALPERTSETIDLLKRMEDQGLLRYVETTSLEAFGGDPAWYFDAIHMMKENTRRLIAHLYGRRSGCALQ